MTATETGREEVERVVHDAIRAILPGLPATGVPGDRHLRDLGADSVDRVEIIVSILERLGVDASLSEFSSVPDVDALVTRLYEMRRP